LEGRKRLPFSSPTPDVLPSSFFYARWISHSFPLFFSSGLTFDEQPWKVPSSSSSPGAAGAIGVFAPPPPSFRGKVPFVFLTVIGPSSSLRAVTGGACCSLCVVPFSFPLLSRGDGQSCALFLFFLFQPLRGFNSRISPFLFFFSFFLPIVLVTK